MNRSKPGSNVPPPPVPPPVPVIGKIIERNPVHIPASVPSLSLPSSSANLSRSSEPPSPPLSSGNAVLAAKNEHSLPTVTTKPRYSGGFPEVFHRDTGIPSSLPSTAPMMTIATTTNFRQTNSSSSSSITGTSAKRPSLFRQRMNALQNSNENTVSPSTANLSVTAIPIPSVSSTLDSSYYDSKSISSASSASFTFVKPLPQSTNPSLANIDDNSISVENMSKEERKAALNEVFSFLSPDTISKWIAMRNTATTNNTTTDDSTEENDHTSRLPSSSPTTLTVSSSASYNPLALDLSGITDEESLQQAVNTLLPESEKAKLRWTGMVTENHNRNNEDEQKIRHDDKRHSSKRVQFTSDADDLSLFAKDQNTDSDEDNDAAADDDEDDDDAVILPNVSLPLSSVSQSSSVLDQLFSTTDSSSPTFSSNLSTSQENIYNKAGTAHLLSLWAKAVEDSEAFTAGNRGTTFTTGAQSDTVADVSVDPGADRMMEDMEGEDSSGNNPPHIDLLSTETINTRLLEIRKNLGLEKARQPRPAQSSVTNESDGLKLIAHSSLYKLRFDLKGLLIKPSWKDNHVPESSSLPSDNEDSSVLYHHGTNPTEAGYTVIDLLGLTRSSIDSQRIMAWKCLTGILLRRRAAFVYPFELCPGCATENTNDRFPQSTPLHDYLFGNTLGCCCVTSVSSSSARSHHSRWNYSSSEWPEEAKRLRTLLLPPILPVLIRSGLDEKKPVNIVAVFQTLFAWCIPTDSMIEGYIFPSLPHELFGTEDLVSPLIRPQPPTVDEDDWAWLVTRRLPYTYNNTSTNGNGQGNDTDAETALNTLQNSSSTTTTGTNRNAATALNDGRTALRDPLLTLCMRMEILERVARIIEGILQRTSNGIVELGMNTQPLLTSLSSTDLTLFIQCIYFLRAAVGRDMSIANYVGRNLAITIDLQRTLNRTIVTGSNMHEGYNPIRRKVRVGLLRFLVYYCTNNIRTQFSSVATATTNPQYYFATIGTVAILRILCQHGIDIARTFIDNENTETLDNNVSFSSPTSSNNNGPSSSATINLPPIRVEDILRFIPVLQSQYTDLLQLSSSTVKILPIVRFSLQLSYETLRLYRVCLFYGLGISSFRVFFTQWFPRFYGTVETSSSFSSTTTVPPLVIFQNGYMDCVRLMLLTTVKELQQFNIHTATNTERDDVFSAVTQSYSMLQEIMTLFKVPSSDNSSSCFASSVSSIVLRCTLYRIFEAYISITRTPSSSLNLSNRNYAIRNDALHGTNLPTLLDLVSNHPIALTTLTEEVLVPLLQQEWNTESASFNLYHLFSGTASSSLAAKEWYDALFLAWSSLSLLIHERIPFVSEQKLWKSSVTNPFSSSGSTSISLRQVLEMGLPSYFSSTLLSLGKYTKPVPNSLPIEITSLSVQYTGNLSRIRNQWYSMIAGMNLFTECLTLSTVSSNFLQQVWVHLVSLSTYGDEGLVWSLLSDTLFRLLPLASLNDELQMKRTLLPLWRDNILGTGNIFLIHKRIILSLLRIHHSYPGLVRNIHSLIQNLQAHSLTTGNEGIDTPTALTDKGLPLPSYSQYMNPYVQSATSSSSSSSSSSILKYPWSCNLGNILYLNTSATNPHQWTNPSDYLSQLLTIISSPLRTPLGLPVYTESLITVPFAIGMFMAGITDTLLGDASAQVQSENTQEIHEILRYENNTQNNLSTRNHSRWIQLCETAMILMKAYPFMMESKHYDNLWIDTEYANDRTTNTSIVSVNPSTAVSTLVLPMVRYGRIVHFLLHAGLVPMKDTLLEELVPFLLSQVQGFQMINNVLHRLTRLSEGTNANDPTTTNDKFVTLLHIILQYPGMGLEAMNTLSKALVTKIISEGVSSQTSLAIVCVCVLLMHGTTAMYRRPGSTRTREEQENMNVQFRRSLYHTLIESGSVCVWKMDEEYLSLSSSSSFALSDYGIDKEEDTDCLQEGSILLATDYRSMVRIYNGLATGKILALPNNPAFGIRIASMTLVQQRLQLLRDAGFDTMEISLTYSEYYRAQYGDKAVYFPNPLLRNSIGGFILYSLSQYLWSTNANPNINSDSTKLSFQRIELLRRMIATEQTQLDRHLLEDNGDTEDEENRNEENGLPVLPSVLSLLVLIE